MTSEEPASKQHASVEGRRRSGRFPVLIPVEVEWVEPSGKTIKVEAQAKEVNTFGGLLQFLDTEAYPAVGTLMELKNLFSDEVAGARTSSIRRSNDGGIRGVAVELLFPSETFWGLTFRLRKTTAELLRLDQAIKS